MMRVTHRPATADEIRAVVPKEIQGVFISRLGKPGDACLSFVMNREVVAVGGVLGVPELSMGEAWVVPAPAFFGSAHAPIEVRDALREWEEKLGYYRYQMVVDPLLPKNVRFAEWMGYEREGLLRAYINGSDRIMYSRIYK